MQIPVPAILALALASSKVNVVFGFSVKSLFGYDTEEITPPARDLIKEFGEEGYKRRLAEAFGEKYSEEKVESKGIEYGVDISYPIHQSVVSTNYDWLPHNMDPDNAKVPSKYENMPVQPLGDKRSFYDEVIKGCQEFYSDASHMCKSTEKDRVNMNLRQPKSMQNYTDIGFKKIRAPAELMNLLTSFYEINRKLASEEKWFKGNTYTNHWASPTLMLSVENVSLPGGGTELKNKIWEAARTTMEAWTGEHLTPCSLYGIRIYQENSILAPHVDRLPLVSSAIINVAQDVDEDWPIEVYAHDGKAYNITMEPGDMVLYESHSVIHGRPFPLKGRFYANVFIHFEPTGHSLRFEDKLSGGDAEEQYMKARKKGKQTGNEIDDLPPYIIKGTPEETRWRQKQFEKQMSDETGFATGSNSAHGAAASGQLELLQKIAKDDITKIHATDENGWLPLHEAVRSGHLSVISYLVEQGSDINARTNDGRGGSALWWAKKSHDPSHPVIAAMKEMGAVEIKPEL